jgi:hypothetical protein
MTQLGFKLDDSRGRTKSVGTSSRTPFKHKLLDTLIGKIIGAQCSGRTPCNNNFLAVDLCAGDGADTMGEGSSSPAIIRKHLMDHRGVKLNRSAILYEKDTATFKRLSDRHADCSKMTLINEDSRLMPLSTVHDRGNDSVFIYADPNNIDQLPITPDLMKGLTPYTLFLITLGCNVGGLKRVDLEHRSKWFWIAAMIRKSLSPFHDLGLITLNNDSSQWAYLVVIPQKWSGSYLQSVEKIGNKMWTGGVSTTSMMRDGDSSLIKQFSSLFLTTQEQKFIKSL